MYFEEVDANCVADGQSALSVSLLEGGREQKTVKSLISTHHKTKMRSATDVTPFYADLNNVKLPSWAEKLTSV